MNLTFKIHSYSLCSSESSLNKTVLLAQYYFMHHFFLTAETTSHVTCSMAKKSSTAQHTRSSERSSNRGEADDDLKPKVKQEKDVHLWNISPPALEYTDDEGPITQDFEGMVILEKKR